MRFVITFLLSFFKIFAAVMALSCLTRALRSLTLSKPALLSSQVNKYSFPFAFKVNLQPSEFVPLLFVFVGAGRSAEAGNSGVQCNQPVQRLPDHSLSEAEQDVLETEG